MPNDAHVAVPGRGAAYPGPGTEVPGDDRAALAGPGRERDPVAAVHQLDGRRRVLVERDLIGRIRRGYGRRTPERQELAARFGSLFSRCGRF